MARIRSIHPGIWTDEEFVSLSMAARLICIGLWNEADDFGVFEWKPIRLKMRLAPVDDIDISSILDELRASKKIVLVSRNGKQYGVIRNFRIFQRPQKPSAPLVTMDTEINTIVGLPAGGIQPPLFAEDYNSPTGIPPQMEDGVGVGVVVVEGISLPTVESAPSRKRAPARRYFKPDEPLDIEFYDIHQELCPDIDMHDEWEKFIGWHTVNRRPTGNAKASYRNWLKNAIKFQNPRMNGR